MIALLCGVLTLAIAADPAEKTRVSIVGNQWRINGQPTYQGSPAEGLLMHVRMVNATFEDRNRADFDPDANTDRFLKALPSYVDAGILAVAISLQGGAPPYEGAVNSAFEPDGTLRAPYLARVARVIDACDRLGAVVILCCFDRNQVRILDDEDDVRRGLENVARWLREQRARNVVLEIAHEFGDPEYVHWILKTSGGQIELMDIARREHPDLLVSSSGPGTGHLPGDFAEAADFCLVHVHVLNNEDLGNRLKYLKQFNTPIICAEDWRFGADAAEAAEICASLGISYGSSRFLPNQRLPFRYDGPADDRAFYDTLRRLTTAP